MNQELNQLLMRALKEDIPKSDITFDCLLKENPIISATVIAKASGIFFGESIFKALFNETQESVSLHVKDGEKVENKTLIATVSAPAKSLIGKERVLLNLIQRLSGIATLTHTFVKKLNTNHISVLDTRKTTPGLRFLEKDAVRAGGGTNHRQNLSDMVLIKENHLSLLDKESALSQLDNRIQSFKSSHPEIKIEIEIETLEQLKTVNFSNIDYVLLDNFSIDDVKEASAFLRKHWPLIEIECSGNINLDTISLYSNLDIDRVSVGSLTHSAKALDISLLIDYN